MGETKQQRYIVAIEIGSSKVRGAVGIADNSGVVDVIAIEEEKLIDKVRYGVIQNIEVGAALQRVIERLEAAPRMESRRITGAYLAVGGRSVMSRTVEVSQTFPPTENETETEITAEHIRQLLVKAGGTEGASRDVIDVEPVRFSVDNKTQLNPIGSYGRTLSARMNVISCVPQIKRMLRRVVEDRIDITIAGHITRTLAEGAMVTTDDERRLGCMLVDFGAETTSVAIYKGGVTLYVATLPMGSRNITLDLCALNKTEERAEEIKRMSGNALPPDVARNNYSNPADVIDYTEINNFVHSRADEIVANIMAQIEYAGLRDKDLPAGIVIVGGGAKLNGFNELLAQQSKMKVRAGVVNNNEARISCGSAQANDAVDVISILVDAATRTPGAECVSEPPAPAVQQPAPGRPATYEDVYGNGAVGADEGESRIGRDTDDVADTAETRTSKPAKTKRGGGLFDGIMTRISRIMKDESEDEGAE